MSVLVRPRSWGQTKPPHGSTINRSHPLAQGLIFVTLQQGVPFDLVSNKPAATIVNGMSPLGSYNDTYTSGIHADFQTPQIATAGTTAQLTLVTFGVWNGGSIAYGALATYCDGSGNQDAARSLQGNNDGTIGGFASGTYVSLASPANAVPFMQVGRATGIAWTLDRWQAGARLSATGPDSISSPIATSSPQIRVHSERSAAQMFPGHVSAVYAWNRVLTDQELAYLAVEPYAFINPPGPKILYVASVATDQTIALSPATITVTPVAVGLTPGTVTLALSPATITVTPVALGRTATVSIALTPATVTVTPVSLGITPGTTTIALTPATITVTPIALGRTTTVSVALNPASITLTPVALGITPGTVSLTLSPATITVTPVALGIAGTVDAQPYELQLGAPFTTWVIAPPTTAWNLDPPFIRTNLEDR